MKKILIVVFIILLILTSAGCGAEKAKQDVIRLVNRNYDRIVTACANGDRDALLAINGIEKIEIAGEYVILFCKGAGIAPSSQGYGFYYSASNSPIAVDCNLDIVCYEKDLSVEGDGYQYVISGNIFYTEHIKGKLYFYSNAY